MSKTFKVIAKTNDISHEDWLSLRRKGLGGSDCAAAIGMNRFRSALDVWLDKTGKVTKEAKPDKSCIFCRYPANFLRHSNSF